MGNATIRQRNRNGWIIPAKSAGRRIFIAAIAAFAAATAAVTAADTAFARAPYCLSSSTTNLTLAGNAIQTGNAIQLTAPTTAQGGAAWFPNQIDVADGFVASFSFALTNTSNPPADGFGFVIQNDSATAIGVAGGGKGFENITNALAVEFETYFGSPDPNGISVQSCGTSANQNYPTCTIGSFVLAPVTMADGNTHYVTVAYTPGSPGTLQVFFDNSTSPLLQVPFDITTIGLAGGTDAWVGVTGGTGGAYERTTIYNLAAGEGAPTAPIFVNSLNSGASAVNVYPSTTGACGNVNTAPSASITGAATGLNYPYGLAYDPNNQDLYAVNYGGGSVTAFSMSQLQTGGNQTPIAAIGGLRTGLAGALGIAVNSLNGDVYAANSTGGPNYAGSVTMYNNSTIVGGGDPKADATIVGYPANANCLSQSVPFNCCTGAGTGSCTNGLYSPQGVAIDPNTGNIFVANLGGPIGTNGMGSITEYAASANGPATPIAEIVGPSTGLSQPTGIAIDANSNLYVANNDGGPSANGTVTIYTPASIAATAPTTEPDGSMGLNVAPDAMIMAPSGAYNFTLLNDAAGIAVDANGLIYVANFGKTGSVTVYPALAALVSEAGYPNVSPIADLTGPATMLEGPHGIAVDPPPTMTRRARRRRHRRRR
ncbi:MAG: lectin-like domain-containing protein [Candidatus Binataceae bacterium]